MLSGQSKKVEEICRELGISDVTYYKWRKEYGGMDVDPTKKLKKLEVKNARLKRMIAGLTLQEKVLRDAVEGNFEALNGIDVVWRVSAGVTECRSVVRVLRVNSHPLHGAAAQQVRILFGTSIWKSINSGISRSALMKILALISKRVTPAGVGTAHICDESFGQDTASPAGADCWPVAASSS